MLSYRNVAVALLAIICVWVWFSNVTYFSRHKADIFIELSHMADRLALPYKIIRLSAEPADTTLFIPVRGISRSDIEDTFGAPRPDGRVHEGLDVFAPQGTPVFAIASGYVVRRGQSGLGGNYVYIIGAGGKRYYYAHLSHFAPGLRVGMPVTVETVLGYVGNTGNASTTPSHLHFGVYGQGAENPYELLVEREIP